MEIRYARSSDLVTLAKIHIDSWQSACRGLVPDSHLTKLDYEKVAKRFCSSIFEQKEEIHVMNLTVSRDLAAGHGQDVG